MERDESDEKKRFFFLQQSADHFQMAKSATDKAEECISDKQKLNRNRQVSFVWNQGFHKLDNMMRRRSLMDPRELQKRREFFGKRSFGETQEYTEAKETKDTVSKHRIVRRHSFGPINSDEKQYIVNRATFATRYHDEEGYSDCSSALNSSSSSSETSFNDIHKNVVYRVSFADPERAEAVQALLSKTKKSIVVQQRTATLTKDEAQEWNIRRVNSAVRIYHNSSSEDIEKGPKSPFGACSLSMSSEDKGFHPIHEETLVPSDIPKKLTEEFVKGQISEPVSKEESESRQTQPSTGRSTRIHTDNRCMTDEKTSIEIKIESQSIPPIQTQPSADTSNQDSSLSLAPLCDLL